MPRLSILIPALETPEALETTLLSILENRPHGCQIVVALGIDYSNPYELEDEVEFMPRAGRGWVECVNAGLTRCRADVVHVLAAGTVVEVGWTKPALEQFARPQNGLVAPLVLDARDRNRALLAGLRATIGGARRPVSNTAGGASTGLAPSWIAGFYRMRMLVELGGFSAAVGDEYADLDLALRAAAAGWQTALAAKSKVFCPHVPRPARTMWSGLRAARFFWRHLPNRGRATALAAHGLVVAGEFASGLWRPTNLLHVAGRLGGWWPAREEKPELLRPAETVSNRSAKPARRAPSRAARRRVA